MKLKFKQLLSTFPPIPITTTAHIKSLNTKQPKPIPGLEFEQAQKSGGLKSVSWVPTLPLVRLIIVYTDIIKR